MRLIDGDELNKQFEKLKYGRGLVDVLFLDGAMAVVDGMPTIESVKKEEKQNLEVRAIYEPDTSTTNTLVFNRVEGKFISKTDESVRLSLETVLMDSGWIITVVDLETGEILNER